MSIINHRLDEAVPALHYLEYSSKAGKTPAMSLIFLHGVTSHAHYWDWLVTNFNFNQDYAVYALDWRGHGDSGQVDSYTQIEDYVSDLQRLLAKLNPPQFVLVGHSLGSYAALVYANSGDPRLRKMVVCDVSTGLTPQERESFQRAAARPQPRFASLEELAARFIAVLPDSTADPVRLAEIARLGARQNEDGTFSFKYDRRTLNMPPPDPIRYAPGVKVPALVINGELSQLVSGAEMARLAAALPRGRHLEISGAGHHVFLDRPDAFAQAVREFLQEGN